MSTAKAVVGAIAAFLSALLAEWPSEVDPVTARDLVVAALAGVVTFSAVFATPNKP